jgi:hypothetical protein
MERPSSFESGIIDLFLSYALTGIVYPKNRGVFQCVKVLGSECLTVRNCVCDGRYKLSTFKLHDAVIRKEVKHGIAAERI